MASPYSKVSQEVQAAREELANDESLLVPQRQAIELFKIIDQVQIFFVSKDGKVSTFSAPSSLRIFKFKEKEDAEEYVPVFIQVNGWSHPLIPEASPVLEAQNGALMFPDVYAEEPGSAVGIILSDEIDPEVRNELVRLLGELTSLKVEEQLPDDQQLGSIGKALVKGASYVCQGMDYGAKKTCNLIEYVGETQKTKYPAATEDAKIGAGWRYSAKGAKYATSATVKVSGFVAKRVGNLSKGLANYVAAKVDKPISGAVVGATGGSNTRSRSMHNIVDAARGGLIAFGTIYTGLEESAKVLGTSIKDHSVTVVEHRYGQEAGVVYGDAMTAAGNGALTYMNVTSLGLKGIAKKTAKNTAKAVGKNVLDAHVDKKSKTAS